MAGGWLVPQGERVCGGGHVGYFNENNKSFLRSLIHLLAPHALNALSFSAETFPSTDFFFL